MQMFAAEHFVRTHHVWTCTACPVHDPRTGEMLGVVDVSGPAETVHPTTVALVGTAVKLAEASLWRQYEGRLEALRGVAAPLLSGLSGPGLVVDDHGWVAAVTGMPSLERVAVPRAERPIAIHGVGVCVPEPIPGGWLLRASGPPPRSASRSTSTTGRRGPSSTGRAAGCTRSPPGTPRCSCCWPTPGRPAWTRARCRPALYGDREHLVTVRAEMSRLRRSLGGLLLARPYRLAPHIDVVLPDLAASTFVRGSTAPGVRALTVTAPPKAGLRSQHGESRFHDARPRSRLAVVETGTRRRG